MLDAPDAAVGVGWWTRGPGWELLWNGADVGPVAGAGEAGDVLRCGAEGGDLHRIEEGGDVDVTVPFEGFEEMGWAGGAGGSLGSDGGWG